MVEGWGVPASRARGWGRGSVELRRCWVVLVAAVTLGLGPPGSAFAVAVAAMSADAPGASAAAPLWSPPVEGEVVGGFDPPASRFGSGHRGADFSASAGTSVRSVGPGVVVFAGRVGNSNHVVVAHAGGLRTSYSYLASVAVRRGQRVERGQVLGVAGGVGEHHDGGVVHLGLRLGEQYLDPLSLFRPAVPADVVRLAPVEERFDLPAEERAARRDIGALVGALARAPISAASAGFGAGASLLGGVGAGARAVSAEVAEGVGVLGEAARFTLGLTWDWAQRDPRVAFTGAVGGAIADWWAERRRCTDAVDLGVKPISGTGHLLVRVAGVGSTSEKSAISKLPVDDLGYRPGEVFDFSYAGPTPGAPYEAADTFEGILRAAQLLAAQLEAIGRREPGREIDLVAHSQGGLVVRAYLELFYDPTDADVPPLGRVVTLASPHKGAPLATAAWAVRGSRSGAEALHALERLVPLPPGSSASIGDLREGAPLLRELDARALPDQIELRTVGATDDVIVPAGASTFDGASSHAIVVPKGWNDHAAITSDPRGVRAVGLALEGRAPPCAGLITHVRAGVVSKVATDAEHDLGTAGRVLGEAVDAARSLPGTVAR